MYPKIIFDVDGPLVFDDGKILKFFSYLERQGIKCDHRTYAKTGDWRAAVPGACRQQIDDWWLNFRLSVNQKPDEPTPGAVISMRQLIDAQRSIATARGTNVRQATESFLDQHYGRFHGYHFSLDCKAAAVRRSGARYFIDDNSGMAQQVANRVDGLSVILFPSPGLIRTIDHPQIIMLAAERLVREDMPPTSPEWLTICRMAWQEIVEIVQMVPA